MTLIEELFMLRRGQIVLIKGGRGTRRTFLHVLDVRDQSLVVIALPFKSAHPRYVQFAIERKGTVTEIGLAVQIFAGADVE